MNIDAEGRSSKCFVLFYPENFFDKTVNEDFIQKTMQLALERDDWRVGNANLFEQDRFLGKNPFEFTIASDEKKKNTFVQKMRLARYTSKDIENDMFEYITTALKKKAKKEYKDSNTYLCILCIQELTSWVLDEYFASWTFFAHDRRREYFDTIKADYIEPGIFKNIFIIFPDIFAKWWVWDVRTDNKVAICLSENDILSQKIPFALEEKIFNEIIKGSNSKDYLSNALGQPRGW